MLGVESAASVCIQTIGVQTQDVACITDAQDSALTQTTEPKYRKAHILQENQPHLNRLPEYPISTSASVKEPICPGPSNR